jgi:hypothetical protein
MSEVSLAGLDLLHLRSLPVVQRITRHCCPYPLR